MTRFFEQTGCERRPTPRSPIAGSGWREFTSRQGETPHPFPTPESDPREAFSHAYVLEMRTRSGRLSAAGGVVSRSPSDNSNENSKGVAPNIMRPKKIILCVDDNELELSVLKFMLATNGYRVVAANNGQEAIGIFSDTAVDLVLSDYAMPQMNGDQLVNRLKQIASHVPMILLGDPQKMGDQLHGADALLAKKSCSPQELLERIKVMSARKRGPRKGAVRMAHAELAVAS
jgi:two-component system, OmpR family, response regulator CpxR